MIAAHVMVSMPGRPSELRSCRTLNGRRLPLARAGSKVIGRAPAQENSTSLRFNFRRAGTRWLYFAKQKRVIRLFRMHVVEIAFVDRLRRADIVTIVHVPG